VIWSWFTGTWRTAPICQQWKSRPYRQARAERSAIESLVFTLKEGFEFGEIARRTHENVLAEMLEKVLAYNISQISDEKPLVGVIQGHWIVCEQTS
jgi:hypothetical protein